MPNNIQVDNKYLESIYKKYGENNPYGVTKSSGYIENTDGNNSNVNKISGDSFTLRGPKSNSNLDVLEYAEDSIYNLMNGLNPEDCYVKNKDGYYELKEDVLQFIMSRIKSLNTIQVFIAMGSKGNAIEMIYETMSGDYKDAEERARKVPEFLDLVLKNNKSISGSINNFVSEIFQKVLEDNQNVFTDRKNAAEDEAEEWHDYLPFCDDEEWLVEEMRNETLKFYNAMRKSLLSMKKVFNQVTISGIDPTAVEKQNKIAEEAISKIKPPDIKVVEEDDVEGGASLGTTIGILVEGIPGLGAALGALIGGLTGTKQRLSTDQLIDINVFKKELSDMKSRFNAPINAQRNQLASSKGRQEARNLVFETMSKIETGSTKMRAVEQVFEEEASQKTQSLDRMINAAIITAKLQNQAVKLNRKLEKMRTLEAKLTWFLKSFATVAAVVVAIVGLALSWTGVGLAIAVAAIGTLAALSALANAYLTADDEYSDDVSKDGHEETAYAEGQTIDEALNRAQNAMGSINRSYIEDSSDGKKRINDDRIATKAAELASAQAGLRIISQSKNTAFSITGAVFSAMSGIKSIASVSPLYNAVYQTQMQDQTSIFNRLVSSLKEYETARNMEIAQSKALTDAWISTAITIGISWACAGIGAGIGTAIGTLASTLFSVGYGLGQAAGQIIGEIGSSTGWWGAEWSDSSLDKEYDNVDTDKFNMPDNVPETGLEASIDYVEAQIYSELFKEGTMDTGDGFMGVNNKKIMELQKRMAQIANVKAIFTLTNKLRQTLSNSVVATMGGVVVSAEQNSLQTVQAQYNAAMQNLDHLQKINNKKTEMNNASRSAEKTISEAAIRGAVQVGVSVVGGALSALTALSAVASIANALMGFINIGTDMAIALDNSQEGYGDINLEDKEEAMNEEARRDNEKVEAALLEKARQEQTRNSKFNKGIITDLGSGKIGVNSGYLSAANQRIRNLARVQRAIAEMLEKQQETKNMVVRAMGGIAVSNAMTLRTSVNNVVWAMLKATQSSFSNLNVYVQRHNQIANYERQFYQALARGVFDAVIAFYSVKQASNQHKSESVRHKMGMSRTSKQKLQDKTAVDRTTLETKERDAIEFRRKMFPVKLATQVVKEWLSVIAGAIYDNTSTGYTEREEAQEQVNQTKAALRGDKGARGMAAMDHMKSDSVASQFEMGEIYLDQEARRAGSRLKRALARNIENLPKSALDKVKMALSTYKETTQAARLNEVSTKKEDEIDKTLAQIQDIRRKEEHKMVFGAQNLAQTEKAHETLKRSLEQSGKPSSKILMELADYLEKSIDMMPKRREAAKNMKPLIKKLKKQAKELRKIRNKQIKLKQKKKEDLITTLVPKNKLQKDPLQGFIPAKEIDQKLTSLQEKYSELKEFETKLRGRAPAQLDPSQVQKLQRMLQGAQALSSKIHAAMNVPQAQIEAAEASVKAETAMAVQKQIDNVLDQLAKDKGKELDKMKPDELQSLYEDLYKKVFIPARETRQATLRLRNMVLARKRGKVLEPEQLKDITKFVDLLIGKTKDEYHKTVLRKLKYILLKSELTPDEKQSLHSSLNILEQVTAETMQKIMGFNRLVGQLNRLHKEKTAVRRADGKKTEGKDLEQYSEKKISAPVVVATKAERREGTARELSVQADVPVETLRDRSGTLLAKLESKIDRIKSSRRQLKVSSRLAEEAYAAG